MLFGWEAGNIRLSGIHARLRKDSKGWVPNSAPDGEETDACNAESYSGEIEKQDAQPSS